MNKIMLNNKLYNDNEIDINLINFGYGCFTTIKLLNSKMQFLEYHYKRLKSHSLKLNIKFDISFENFINLLNKYIKMTYIKNGAIRYNIMPTGFYISFRNQVYEHNQTIKITISETLSNPTSKLINIKSNNYLEKLIDLKNAKKSGFDEVLYLNFYKEICECSTANIFFIKNDKIYTPDLKCGLLNGIIRQIIIENFDVITGKFYLDNLLNSNEIFITNCLRTCMSVSQINNKNFTNNKIAKKITNYINSIHT
jgi:4-amino-4-deoxychorismate lyase